MKFALVLTSRSFVVTSLYIVLQYIVTINLLILWNRTHLSFTKVTQKLDTVPVKFLSKASLPVVLVKTLPWNWIVTLKRSKKVQNTAPKNKDTRKKQKVQNTAAKKKALISITNPQRIKLTLRQQRLKCNQLQEEIYVMKNEINKNNYSIGNELTQDFINIISNNKYKMTPFMELFWQQ